MATPVTHYAARPGEVLVSRTVKDLAAGSGLRFNERGRHALKLRQSPILDPGQVNSNVSI